MDLAAKDSRMVRTFQVAVAIFFLVVIGGVRSRYFAMALVPFFMAAYGCDRDRGSFFDRIFSTVPISDRALGGVCDFLLLCSVAFVPLSNFFYFQGMDADYFDWGLYIQGTSNLAKVGTAFLTVGDGFSDAERMHFSVVMPLLAELYRWFATPTVLVIWQSVFLVAPVFLFLFIFRRYAVAVDGKRDPLAELLCAWAFLFSPIISGNFQWPYVWHILGPFFFAGAFLFYDRKRYVACFFSLALFCLQKQEFAIFTAAFGLFVGLDAFIEKRKKLFGLAILTLIFGAGYYYFASRGRVLSFSDRFGNLGDSPKEAFLNLFLDPSRYFSAWSSWPSIRFFSYFAIASFVFLAPRWRAFRYLVVVLPIILLFGSEAAMKTREFRNHYALPLMIALFAALTMGVLPALTARGNFRSRARSVFLGFLIISAFWAQNTPFHELQRTVRVWAKNHADRDWIETIRASDREAICCEGRLCSLVADRPILIFAEHCFKGSQILAERAPIKTGLLLYADSPVPEGLKLRWIHQSSFLKFGWLE